MKKTFLMSAVAFTIALTSCSKESKALQSKTYTMTSFANSGITGTVTFNETAEGTTSISIEAHGTTASKTYASHIHNGLITNPGSVNLDFGPQYASSTDLHYTKVFTNKYTDMIVNDGCFVMHNPDNASTYVLVGNIGKNAP